MVVAEPSAELLGLVRSEGDPPVLAAPPGAVRQAELIRRRFGLALPPLFLAFDAPVEDEPIRLATAFDGAAIASVKWRAYGVNYRGGVLPDAFIDQRDVVPPASFWTGRAMVPPSRRHRLLVWGRPGRVLGYVDAGPAHPEDIDHTAATADPADDVGEIFELYVDPAVQGRGGGTRLLAEATDALAQAGFTRLELNVLATNPAAQGFYRHNGWEPTGQVRHVDLGAVAFDEARFSRRLVGGA